MQEVLFRLPRVPSLHKLCNIGTALPFLKQLSLLAHFGAGTLRMLFRRHISFPPSGRDEGDGEGNNKDCPRPTPSQQANMGTKNCLVHLPLWNYFSEKWRLQSWLKFSALRHRVLKHPPLSLVIDAQNGIHRVFNTKCTIKTADKKTRLTFRCFSVYPLNLRGKRKLVADDFANNVNSKELELSPNKFSNIARWMSIFMGKSSKELQPTSSSCSGLLYSPFVSWICNSKCR